MKKNLKTKKAKPLTITEQKSIVGGISKDWFKCCLKEDSPELLPYGCEAWLLCDGVY